MPKILKNPYDKGFVIVPREYVTDKTLKLRERGLIVTILSLPDEWDFNIKGLATITGEGRDSVSKSVRILKEKGYLIEYQERNSDGKFGRIVVEICPGKREADDSSSPCTELPCTEKPDTDNPSTGKPDSAEPCTGNPAQYNNNKSNNNRSNNKKSNNNKCIEGGKESDGGESRVWTDAEKILYGV